MDKKDKISDTVKNILKIGGAIAVACVMLDDISDKDEFEKISIGEPEKDIKRLTDGKQYEEADKEKERDEEKKNHENEVTELKRKIAELEEKKTGQFGKEG